jgi:hypothetical protein
MSLDCANQIATSQEILDYIKGSVDALNQIRGTLPGQNRNSKWGLPAELYGFPLVIEDTYKVTSPKGASTLTTVPILGSQTPFMCSRVGGLVSDRAPETPAFSTHVIFMKEELTVEQFEEPINRRTRHHVVDDYDCVLAAPVTGVLFQSATTY